MSFSRIVAGCFYILLSSCYTSNKANKAIQKAYVNYPAIVAERAMDWFPCIPAGIHDSIDVQVLRLSDTIKQISFHDTLIVQRQLNKAVQIINRIKEIPVKDSAEIYILKNQFNELQKEKNEYQKKNEKNLRYINWLLLLLCGLFLINIISNAIFKKRR